MKEFFGTGTCNTSCECKGMCIYMDMCTCLVNCGQNKEMLPSMRQERAYQSE